MSEQPSDTTASKTEPTAPPAAPPAAKNALSDLMAAGDPAKVAAKPATPKATPDLDAEALRAAEHALAEGQKALAAARAHIATTDAPAPKPRHRETWLRTLLALNIVAMIVVASMPAPAPKKPVADPHAHSTNSGTAQERFNDPWNRALAAAESRDFGKAIAILDDYLASSPRMAASQQLSVLMALAHYSSRKNDFKAAQEYQRRADAIDKSHSLPEDLVATAKAAAESGDQEQLRRIQARFLLQQRQVPNWLYKHVAEAYLQLGDSYRLQANAAAEAERVKQLEQTAKTLREQETASEGHK